MSQNINLSISGLYTAPSDLNGLPPGALRAADNIEIRYKNLAESRRGFDQLPNSMLDGGVYLRRLSSFFVEGVDSILGLTSEGDAVYYTGDPVTPWPLIPGNVSQNILNPDDNFAKSRFLLAGHNIYLTALDGPRSLASGSSSTLLRAGVPKALNISGVTNGDQNGFFTNNIVLTTEGKVASGSNILTNLDSTTLSDGTVISVGLYITGSVSASKVIQDLTYTAVPLGTPGNAISVAYTGGGTAGSEVVTVVGNAISVQIQNSVSTADQVFTAINTSIPALALVSVVISGTSSNAQTTVAATSLTGGVDNAIPIGTTVVSITNPVEIVVQTGTLTATSNTITAVASLTNIVAGVLIFGSGIPDGATVVSASGTSVIMDRPAFQTATAVTLAFFTPLDVKMSQNATASASNMPISFYRGAQVAYRILYVRVENDRGDTSITRLGSPSTSVIVNNISPYSTNVTISATLPKNSSTDIGFVQLYRSIITQSITIPPPDQYKLVFERPLVAGDFTGRVITITDDVPEALVGIPLYTGADQEGALQANDPPPMAWDMGTFRDFSIFGNITNPSSFKVTIVATGAPNGIQVGDTITIAGTFVGSSFTETYTAASSENQASRQFEVFSTGTPAQDIADTADSLIRVINYDWSLPVHAILLSTVTDLPGQIFLEADHPSLDTFTITASAHQDAYDPSLNNLTSDINTVNNAIAVSKSGELEAVPITNILFVGNASSPVLRVIALRDYIVVFKSDGIYKIVGLAPNQLVITPFSLTTKIIGPDTAVAFNDGAWALTNQGVIVVNDGGVDLKSVPIDSDFTLLLGNHLSTINTNAFAIGYESDRKYVLCMPISENTYAEREYNFNYITNAWTTWSRNFYAGFLHPFDNILYFSCADATNMGVSKERKSGDYKDYVDEGISGTIISVNGTTIVLSDTSDVSPGDILFQSSSIFTPILSVDTATETIIVEYLLDYAPGDVSILKAYLCTLTWMQVFGENPAFARQFSEGIVLFKNTRFNTATLSFTTDYSQTKADVAILGQGNSLWGLFPWGGPWGGATFPSNDRFLVPSSKQFGSYVIPTLKIQQGYSNFSVQGLSISYTDISEEVGK